MSKVYHARVFYFRFTSDISDKVRRSIPQLPPSSSRLSSAAWDLRYSLKEVIEGVPQVYGLQQLKEYLRDLD